MTISALKTSSKSASKGFNREDWASAYCNVEKELKNVELKLVKGKVPNDLCGTFYRNGPGQLERGGQWVHHPFDGDGMIAAIQFKEGKVKLTNKFIRTKAWEEEQKAQKFLYRGVFGTQKPGGPLSNAFDLRLKNIANTNVIKLGENLLALWEADSPHALNPRTLETYGLSSLDGTLKEKEALSAHPRFDPGHNDNPRMVTFGVKTGPKSTIRLLEFESEGPNAGNLISDRKDTFNGFAFLHDFAITPNWAIFLQNAIEFNPLPYLIGQKGAAQCLKSKKNGQAKLLLIPRDSGCFAGQEPKVCNAPNGFVFHHLNAYENNDKIILESIFYSDFPSIGPDDDFRQINFDQIPEGKLKRCIINTKQKEIKISTISEQCCEFAMVNPRKQGKYAQYAWMASSEQKVGNGPLQAIKKIDLKNNTEYIWSAAPRGFVNEPLMIPSTSSDLEDDGWVIVLIWNGERLGTDLIILKANDLSEQAILELPISIPYGLHGSWVSESN